MASVAAGVAIVGCTAISGTAEDRPAEWGKPCKGVVAGLRTASNSVGVGQPMTFSLEVRNPGSADAQFPTLGRFESWRLQFESDTGKLYEYSYFCGDARSKPMNITAGATVALELPVMLAGIIGTFKPIVGLTELPAGRYRVRAFVPFYSSADAMPQGPSSLELGNDDRSNWLISSHVDVCVGRADPVDAAADGWRPVGDEAQQERYSRNKGNVEVFTGTLEVLPPQKGISTMMRDHGYKLGARLIQGRNIAALDAHAGEKVELRGKRVDMKLEGMELREIAPGAIRSAK